MRGVAFDDLFELNADRFPLLLLTVESAEAHAKVGLKGKVGDEFLKLVFGFGEFVLRGEEVRVLGACEPGERIALDGML